jgi:hypothetical protein
MVLILKIKKYSFNIFRKTAARITKRTHCITLSFSSETAGGDPDPIHLLLFA